MHAFLLISRMYSLIARLYTAVLEQCSALEFTVKRSSIIDRRIVLTGYEMIILCLQIAN